MADIEVTEAPVEVPEAPVEASEAPEAAPAAVFDDSYDEALLIKVKGKVKRPARPDDTERNLQVQKLQEAIDKASARMKEIKGILDSRASGGKTASPEQQALRDRLAQLRQEFDTVLLQKRRLMSESDDKKTDRDKLFAEQRAIKDTIRGPSNLQALETTLAELEFKLTHESLSAAQEKAMREKKERIERTDKPAVARLAQVSAKIDEAKAASDAIRAEISVLNTQLDGIKAQREEANAKLDALRAEQQEARSDIPGLMVEKKELWEVIQTLRDKQREIRVAFNEKWEEFKKQDKAWKGWFAQERKRRQEQRKVEYEERQAARKARDGEVAKPAKFEMEVYTCEQVLSYLKQFVAVKAASAVEMKEVEAPAPGMKLLAKKGDDDSDSLFTGMGGKKGRGARKAAEKQKAVDTVKKLPAVLPLETLKTFMALGIEAPKGSEDVPRAIAAVEAKKAEYEARRDKAAAEPPSEEEEEPAEEEEAAAEEAAGADAAEEAAEPKAEDEAEAKDEAEPAAAEEEAAAEPEAAAAAEPEEAAKPEANGNSEEPKAEANGNGPAAAAAAEVAAEAAEPKAEANGNSAAEAKAEANGDAAKAKEEAAAEEEVAKTADDVKAKLRVTDDGEVNLELAV
ncbi:hypothetical protein OEZ85_010184 [Tetradesmus obliquus]|uniref:DUF4201 domain-containing protein n=1 Tax=Tetradesmus obliquus TaxID=3088 RepID=A0ABY8TLX5_TETOB|nr:hypothetical protein OEZ85_010184 [Tetradesmus obliquus]